MSAENTTITLSKPKAISKSRRWFFLIAAALFLLAAFYSTSLQKDIRLLERVKPIWLIAALFGQLLTYFFGALVYAALLTLFKTGHHQLTLGRLIQATLINLFLNQMIPSVGVSGNTYIFRLLTKSGLPASQALQLILIELLTFYAAVELLIITVCLYFLIVSMHHIPAYLNIVLLSGFCVYLFFAFATVFMGKRQSVSWIIKKMARLRLPLLKKLQKKFNTLLGKESPFGERQNLWQLFKKNRATIGRTIGYQICIYFADVFTIYCMFQGLSTPLSPILVFIGLVATRVITVLPISPGGLILYESSMTFFYVSLGAPVSIAIIVTLLFRLLAFWLPMPFGLFMYRRLLKSGEEHSIAH